MPDQETRSQASFHAIGDGPVPGRPYGPIGLAFSIVPILLATALLCAVVAGLLIASASAVVGWHDVADRLTTLELTGGRNGTIERMGIVLARALYAAFRVGGRGAGGLRGGARGWRPLVAWRPWHPFRSSRLTWILLAVTLVYSLGADLALERLYPASKDWVQLPRGPIWSALFILLAVVAAPITEELFFRGWLYTGLRARAGAAVTITVTAVLFALAHWEKTHLYALAVFPVGVALGFIRERAGSIGATMAFHAGYNGFASILLLSGP